MNKSLGLLLIITMVMIMLDGCAEKESKTAAYPPLDPKNMDTAVAPGDDFFQYANGGWMKANPIPAEFSRFGAFDEIMERNYDQLKDIMESASSKTDAKKGSLDQLIGDFYASGMDTAKIEKAGITPLKEELELIDNIKNVNDIQKEIAHLNLYGIFPGFILYAGQDEKNSEQVIANTYQGGLGLHDRDYYLSDDPRSVELRKEYLKHLAKMFELMGENEKTARDAAGRIMQFETSLAKASRTRVDLRDPVANYNKMSISDCQQLTPAFDWKRYLVDLNLNVHEINLGQPEFLTRVSELLEAAPIEDWKLYLKWNLVSDMAPYLSSDFVDENFRFYGTVFSGKEKLRERWKRVLATTSGNLGEAVGQLYVKKYFPPEAKEKMLTLVSNLKKSLGSRIAQLEWMGKTTKDEALNKLAKMNVKIGYPNKWIDYSKVEISRDSYVRNILNTSKFLMQRDLNKIGKPVDREEWHMTPQTVNAYYSPNMNEIVFPAAILQPPFFNIDADDAVNYAAIGTVIGHEMTHGFDDQGRMYDKYGNLKDWWTKEDSENFKKRIQVLEDQYNKFVAIDTMKVNGKLTLGENIADFGGITVSYNAWKLATDGMKLENIDGFTPQQRFFLSYAQVWRQNIRPQELMKRLKEDVHSPGKFRTNGVVRNVPQFYEAFDISKNDDLYLAPENRAVIW
jgi:putative endopeptidase